MSKKQKPAGEARSQRTVDAGTVSDSVLMHEELVRQKEEDLKKTQEDLNAFLSNTKQPMKQDAGTLPRRVPAAQTLVDNLDSDSDQDNIYGSPQPASPTWRAPSMKSDASVDEEKGATPPRRKKRRMEEEVEPFFAVVPGALMRFAELVSSYCHLRLFQLVRTPVTYDDNDNNEAAEWQRFMTPVFFGQFSKVIGEIKRAASPKARALTLQQLITLHEVRDNLAMWVGFRIVVTQVMSMKTWPRKETLSQVNSGISQAIYFFQTYS